MTMSLELAWRVAQVETAGWDDRHLGLPSVLRFMGGLALLQTSLIGVSFF